MNQTELKEQILQKANELYSELPESIKKNFGNTARKVSVRAAADILADEELQNETN